MNLWYIGIDGGYYFLYPSKEQKAGSFMLADRTSNFMELVSSEKRVRRSLDNIDYKLVIPKEYM